ncbi:MAG: hypothetical protein C6I00_00885 [Nitratiruptor sp.]|nr:hypothetical protein [Nitratiruptor sp.]NPA83425.1 hypothetical protein [Campylobacterota bacterium]
MATLILRELFVYALLLILFTLSFHAKEFLADPIPFLQAFFADPAKMVHPLVYTIPFYLLILLIRILIHFASRRR